MRGVIVGLTGPLEVVDIDGLRSMQDVVGGYIELVPLRTRRMSMYVNEEGILQGLPLNRWASVLADQSLFGPALILGPDENGVDTEVSDVLLDWLMSATS